MSSPARADLLRDRPGRNRTCNPRFWSAVPATRALKPLLIFNDLASSEQRRRCWTTPALALILALLNRHGWATGLRLTSASPSPGA